MRSLLGVSKAMRTLVVQGKFPGADAEGLGAVLKALVRNGMLRFPNREFPKPKSCPKQTDKNDF